MHPKISVNVLCFPGSPLNDDLAVLRGWGAQRVGLTVQKLEASGWDAGVDAVRASGLIVATIVHPFMYRQRLDDRDAWPEARAALMRTIAAARTLHAESIYMTTGYRGRMTWEGAATAFSEAVSPCVAFAGEMGVPLLIEPAPTFRADVYFNHSLRDTVQLAEQAGIGVCIDIFNCWTEAGLDETIVRAMPRCGLVQVSDYRLGDTTPRSRAIPGDGVIPLERILGWIARAGYRGAFDLELIGPAIDTEGHKPAVYRAVEQVGTWLTALGA